jgi:hypothetical protein
VCGARRRRLDARERETRARGAARAGRVRPQHIARKKNGYNDARRERGSQPGKDVAEG